MPAINYGLRGIAYYELHVTGPNRDLHSGSFGGSVTNPANALAQILAGLMDRQGRVTIPGFYDDVVPLTDRERQRNGRAALRREAIFRADRRRRRPSAKRAYTTLERRWVRPTFDVSGLWGGYQGEGAKTVLPAPAGAKFSFRLVPNQDPAKITAGLKWRLAELAPPGVEVELIEHHGAPGVLVPLDSPYIEAAARAIRARLRPPARLHPRRRLDPHRHHLPRAAWRRCAAAGLGPRRRQHPQPQREVRPGRFPSRHQGQRQAVGRTRAECESKHE